MEATASAELNRLLDEMLDLPSSERERWVHTLAPEHEAFKPRLLVLLSHAAAVETDDFLNTLPRVELGPDEQAGQSGVSGSAGDEIGPYRLVRELGTGGMGSVWLADRADVLINRPIALKLPHGPWKRAGLAERMAREREILATLTHPNIARLYDAGLSADGQPYLAIEYVDGKPIGEYCEEKEVSVKDRLKLFLQVASAVAYAHAKLVVHRDLKPSNILVTVDGQAHLLDFGIAKLLEPGAAQETNLTQASGRALTPDYASPEQILGEPITIASDVYSLGVLLYELLTGARPYKLTRDSRGALEDAILQVEPGTPSDVVGLSSRKALRGDLDTIVLKALKKKPEERYTTVHALLEDIERHLSARPVLAQPDSAWYRLNKFTRRHKLAVGAAVAVLIAILAGAGVAGWQARIAVAEKERAEQVKSFVLAVFREANPYRSGGKVLSSVDLLRIAKSRIDQVDKRRVDVRVELLNTLADSLLMLDDTATAEEVLTQALHEGEGVLAPDHRLLLEAKSMLSQVYRRQSRPAQMRAVLDDLLPVLRAKEARYPRHLVAALLNLGNLSWEQRRLDESEAAVSEALRVITSRLGDREVNKVMLLTLQSLVYQERGRQAAALASADAALRAARDFHAQNDKHAVVLNARHQHAVVLMGLDAIQGAREVQAVLRDTEESLGEDNRTLGMRLTETSEAFLKAGLTRDAVLQAQESVRIVSAHQLPDSQILADARLALGRALLAMTCRAQAMPELTHALAVSARTFGSDSEFVARIRRDLAVASTAEGPSATCPASP